MGIAILMRFAFPLIELALPRSIELSQFGEMLEKLWFPLWLLTPLPLVFVTTKYYQKRIWVPLIIGAGPILLTSILQEMLAIGFSPHPLFILASGLLCVGTAQIKKHKIIGWGIVIAGLGLWLALSRLPFYS